MRDKKFTPKDDWDNGIEISYEGTSKMALLKGRSTIAGNNELAIEKLTKAAKAIIQGSGTITPFIIAVVHGKPKVIQLEQDEKGHYILPVIKNITSDDLKRKRKIVQKLMEKISPVLKADIEKVTYIALMRKDERVLKHSLKMILDTKEKPQLVNRLGCIYVEVGDECFQI